MMMERWEYNNISFVEKVVQVDEMDGDDHVSAMNRTRGKTRFL